MASMSQLLRDGYLAPSAEVARARLSRRYSCQLTRDGIGVEGISRLRNLIQRMDADRRYCRALLISAPHTHWGDTTIIESFDESRDAYLNGPIRSRNKSDRL